MISLHDGSAMVPFNTLYLNTLYFLLPPPIPLLQVSTIFLSYSSRSYPSFQQSRVLFIYFLFFIYSFFYKMSGTFVEALAPLLRPDPFNYLYGLTLSSFCSTKVQMSYIFYFIIISF